MARKLYQYVAQLSKNESYLCRDWFLFCKALFMASSLPHCVYLVYSTMLPIGRTLSHCLAIKASEHYPRALSWHDKLTRIRRLLDSFANCRSARLVELQSLIGTLQFACKVVVPGRTFLQCMINLTRGASSCFHHIRLNKESFSR